MLLQGLALLGLAICAPLILLPDLSPGSLILTVGLFGFAQYPLYGVCIGIARAQLPEQSGSQTVSELLLLFGFGTIVGPVIGGQAMRSGPQHLFSFIVVALIVLVVAVTVDRLRIRHRTSSADYDTRAAQ